MLELEQQNKFMNKVTLTGKINAMDVAANLFEFTDKTAEIFDELKSELINALLDENMKKVTNELTVQAQTTINILIRNLFERTADVGFLSTDAKIVSYLTSDRVSHEEMDKHLQEYVAKYSVYNEILIFDTKGNLKINFNKENRLTATHDSIIQDALTSDEYVERYADTDIFQPQKKILLYAQKITHNQQAIGVLVLCFKLEDELSRIFENLSQSSGTLALLDKKEILISSAKMPYTPYSKNPYSIIKNNAIAVTQKASSYQGYKGIEEWYAIAMLHTKEMKDYANLQEEENQESYTALLADELHIIIEKANNILEDIADVIINGELIACKQKVYLLTPILDNLRSISMELLSCIKKSIKNLEYVVKDGLIHDAKMTAKLAIDIMDRNLYERANDSRWWALTQIFKEELQKENPDQKIVQKELLYINNLYTVYTEILLFDADKTIVATSNNQEIVGQKIEGEFINKTLQNKNTQNYFVSEFEESSLYNNEATYIYAASITNGSKTVGGVAVIFDATVEFKAILQDSFPESYDGFVCFIDANKRVISSSDASIKPLSTLEIDDKFIQLKEAQEYYDFITFKEQKYIVASAASKGYREYKKEDNYKNEIYCVAFLKV